MDHVVLTQAVTRRKVADRIRQAPGNASILGHEAGPYAMTMEDLLSREAKQNGDQCESWQSRNNTIQNPSLEPGTREILKHRTYGRSVGTRTLEVLMIPWRTHPDVGPGSRASRGAKRAYPWLEWIPATSPATGLQHQKFSAKAPGGLGWWTQARCTGQLHQQDRTYQRTIPFGSHLCLPLSRLIPLR